MWKNAKHTMHLNAMAFRNHVIDASGANTTRFHDNFQ